MLNHSPVKLWFSSKVIATDFFQRHWIVGWLFNNILKIRQNQFGERCEKLAITRFSTFTTGHPISGRSQIQTKSLIILFFFLKNFRWNIANVFWVVCFKKRWQNVWETRGSVFRLGGYAQTTQLLVCLHILFSKL